MTTSKILVADDEPQIRRVMRTALTGQGYIVVDAKSGDEALARTQAGAFRSHSSGRQHARAKWN